MLPRLDGDVLELCVGSGMLTEHVPTTYRSYTGLDLSAHAARDAAAEDAGPDAGRRAMPKTLSFEDASFDAVVVFAGLHHLPDIERAIAQSARCPSAERNVRLSRAQQPRLVSEADDMLRDWIGIYSEDEVFLDARGGRQRVASGTDSRHPGPLLHADVQSLPS